MTYLSMFSSSIIFFRYLVLPFAETSQPESWTHKEVLRASTFETFALSATLPLRKYFPVSLCPKLLVTIFEWSARSPDMNFIDHFPTKIELVMQFDSILAWSPFCWSTFNHVLLLDKYAIVVSSLLILCVMDNVCVSWIYIILSAVTFSISYSNILRCLWV